MRAFAAGARVDLQDVHGASGLVMALTIFVPTSAPEVVKMDMIVPSMEQSS
jgi:hypothetical protein